MNGNDYDSSLYLQQLADELHSRTQHTSSTTVISALLLIVLAYQLFTWLDYPILSLSELLWNTAIRATPSRFIFALESLVLTPHSKKARKDTEHSVSKTHAQKSDTMRRVLGLDGTGILSTFQQARSLPAVGSMLRPKSNSPPGLGNWDNSCYQNSVIQGLASLPSFAEFLDHANLGDPSLSTKAALRGIIEKLKDHTHLGTMFWTPAQLKSMSSWQQQDAQEYFSKLMDEIETETTKSTTRNTNHAGLAAVQIASSSRPEVPPAEASNTKDLQPPSTKETPALCQLPGEVHSIIARNPLEGLLAQRVGCLKCGYVEGLSLIPFNCLTLPLGKQWYYDIRSCLDEYTDLEPINGVDCAKCTLLNSKTQLEKLRSQLFDHAGRELPSPTPSVTDAFKASVEERLRAVTEALENEDYTDNTILKRCQISQKARITSTKTRQAIIARAPKSLAIHINRSVFDEMTGVLSKNYADVRFPLRFSLTPWCLGGQPVGAGSGDDLERWSTDPAESMLIDNTIDDEASDSRTYELRAALTHYGRHENGHYICYRRHELSPKGDGTTIEGKGSSWWRFSDEDVSPVSEADVLAQGGVFMLFYERVDTGSPTPGSSPLTTEQEVPDLAGLKIESNADDTIIRDLDANRRLTMQPPKDEIEAEDDDKATQNITSSSDALDDPTISTTESDTKTSSDQSSSVDFASKHQSNDTEVSSQTPITSSLPEPNQTTPPSSNLPSADAVPTDPSPTAPNAPHPPLLPPSQTSQTDTRNISHSMRTATPRSGRGSISRGKKGMGQISSMVISH
ncbi:MAG: hypothetical protein Q9166_004126 [cf. Caloplaca sp. 2 TL-2023]